MRTHLGGGGGGKGSNHACCASPSYALVQLRPLAEHVKDCMSDCVAPSWYFLASTSILSHLEWVGDSATAESSASFHLVVQARRALTQLSDLTGSNKIPLPRLRVWRVVRRTRLPVTWADGSSRMGQTLGIGTGIDFRATPSLKGSFSSCQQEVSSHE